MDAVNTFNVRLRKMSITPEQCRAARALIGWSQAKLASASSVSQATIANFEGGRRIAYDRTLSDLQSILETSGVIFIAENGEGPGVRLRKATHVGLEDAERAE